jgi:hypothetical protein
MDKTHGRKAISSLNILSRGIAEALGMVRDYHDRVRPYSCPVGRDACTDSG